MDKNKQQFLEDMLSKGDTMICLDSGYPGVKVPDNHQGNPDLRLVLNLNFRHSISTFPDGIQAELLFGGVPFLCWIPYESLWAVYNPQTGEGYLWPGQAPVSLRDLLGDEPGAEQQKGEVRHLTPSASPKQLTQEGLRSVSESPEKAEGSDRKGRSKFRVIKGGKKN